MANGVDQAGDSSETVQATARQIGDMRYAAERDQVMRAYTMYGNSPDHDHVATVVGKSFAECLCWIKIVAAEQASLP